MVNSDFRDPIALLTRHDARFLIVGGYAVAAHGYACATKDLDIWVDPNPDNAPRVMAGLTEFGAPLGDLTERDLMTPRHGFMMGAPPRRIDILTAIDGVNFADAWPRRVTMDVGAGMSAPFLALEDLLVNKRASARPQDLADVAALTR